MTGLPPVLLECDFCGHRGAYPEEVVLDGQRHVCRTERACDERDAVRSMSEEEVA